MLFKSLINSKDLVVASAAFEKLSSAADTLGIVLQKPTALITKDLGDIHILVNNAGIIKRELSITMPVSDFRKVIDVDLVGPFIMSQLVAKQMIERKEGKIINICSMMMLWYIFVFPLLALLSLYALETTFSSMPKYLIASLLDADLRMR